MPGNQPTAEVLIGTTDNTSDIRTTAGGPAPGQTAKSYVGKQATSASVTTTVTLETVTAGKTFFITDIYIGTDIASATQILDVGIQAAGAYIGRWPIHNLSPVSSNGIETQPVSTTGQLVTLLLPITAGGVVNVYYDIAGFEQ